MGSTTQMSEENFLQLASSNVPLAMEVSERTSLQGGNVRLRWRNMVAFWLLGLCNNYGYVVMLSAAHDVLSTETDNGNKTNSSNSMGENTRDCNQISTGAILLADILPSLFVKLIAPFLPFFINIRMVIIILLSCSGFLLVAFSTIEWITILGVVATSLASGLGELTILAYTPGYDKSVISMWSSGTGGAGVLGAGSYAGLTALGLSPSQSLLLMLVVPVIMAISFWLILQHPAYTCMPCCDSNDSSESQDESSIDARASINSTPIQGIKSRTIQFLEKLHDIPPLFKFMIPLAAVYLFEYFINQGLFELIYFPGIWIDHKEQYRWLQLDYQIGVFISRSSASCFTFNKIWLLAVLQFINVVVLTFEVLYFYIPSIWLVFAIVLWEGCLGGGAYVNTYHRISNEVPPDKKKFSLSITTVADAIGIGLAGAIAIPVHNVICDLPRPST